MNYLSAILIGYTLGCINPAYFFAKAKGFDIRTKGTMSAGASNAKTTMGWKYGIICGIYDILKSVIAMLLVKLLVKDDLALISIAGCSAIIGHIFPFYLNFKGGKGFAAYIGMVAFLNWKPALILAVIGVSLSLITNWIVMATLTFTIGFPLYNLITASPIEMIAASLITSVIILLKHLVNFKRILQKEEIGINGKKTGIKLLKSSDSAKENL
ncbi:MAG: glycerol-3-phosphate acyltransferase [Erysipelotrichaceae bacterium]